MVKICHAGDIDEELLYLIIQNSREPLDRELDLRVQIATNERGRTMLEELVAHMGIAAVEGAIDDLLAYTSRRIRNRIQALPDGEGTFTRYLDDDGLGGEQVWITATVRVRGDRLEIDFAGSSPQARGAMSVPESALRATCYYCVKTMLDPALAANSGLFDAIDFSAPVGSIVNPRFPAATGARSITANKVAGAIFGAFQNLVPPERVMASSHDAVPAIVFSGERLDGEGTYVYLETIGGGAGARHDRDGMDGIHVHITNSSNLPAEALENEYALLVDEYALVNDSGGSGRYRGGLGLARQIRAMEDGVIFSVRADNHIVTAPGAYGGLAGGPARLIQNIGTPEEFALGSKVSQIVLNKGETMRLESGGGGGFGPPAERRLPLLAADLRGGKISRARAERDYGPEMVRRALGEVA